MDPRRISALFAVNTEVAVKRVAPEDVASLAPLFPEEEPGRHWVEKRVREFRAGRHVAREVLVALGNERCSLAPDADGVPSYPTGISASLTHTGRERTLAIAAGTRELFALGIDVEERRSLDEGMSQHILTDREAVALTAFGPLPEISLLAFSGKESFYKCVYPRLRRFLNFHEVELDLEPTDPVSGRLYATCPIAGSLGAPTRLEGRYLIDDEFVFTTFAWAPPERESPIFF